MAPWRQAFFDMSWRRWQFWLFAGVLSYAVIPVVEELLFRGYYQRRLAEDWGNGPAIIGTACFFAFAHPQYLIPNAYNVTMVMSLFCLAIGLGVVFAWTRSIFPSMIAHSIINVPLTPLWQGVLLVIFAAGVLFARRGGARAVMQTFARTRTVPCFFLAAILVVWVIAFHRMPGLTPVGIGLLAVALGFAIAERLRGQAGMPASAPAVPAVE
jgi:hypothetical protein